MDNFFDTAKRMYNSSQILHQNGVYHNSCYLGGYVIECYAKIIVGVFSTRSARGFNHNINSLNNALKDILTVNITLAPYILDGNVDYSTILANWNPGNLRYIHSSGEIIDVHLSNSFQSEIDLAMKKLAKIQLDGYTLI